MSVLKVLSRDTWIQRNYALDAEGYVVSDLNPTACRFCVLGAINRVYGIANREAREKFRDVIGEIEIVLWNDCPGRTWEEVESAIKKAGI